MGKLTEVIPFTLVEFVDACHPCLYSSCLWPYRIRIQIVGYVYRHEMFTWHFSLVEVLQSHWVISSWLPKVILTDRKVSPDSQASARSEIRNHFRQCAGKCFPVLGGRSFDHLPYHILSPLYFFAVLNPPLISFSEEITVKQIAWISWNSMEHVKARTDAKIHKNFGSNRYMPSLILVYVNIREIRLEV